MPPASFSGMRVLDVGRFDGFCAFLAEYRGPGRVLAIDNEQYRPWVASRCGIELTGGEGSRSIGRLLDSTVEYRRMDAFALARLEEQFDFIYCCGILHRVENPVELLRVLRRRTVPGGIVLVESYGVRPPHRMTRRFASRRPGEIYTRDEFVYGDSRRRDSNGWSGSPGSPACSRPPTPRSTGTHGSSGSWSDESRGQ
jgi:tRNA (mo5U34)-methyltransferase